MTAPTPPILLIIFNRPDKVRALIGALSNTKPKQLYIIADGPRSAVPTDDAACAEARALATQIPWECEVHTKFLDENVGCDSAVPIGIDWFFENVEEGIILEDDCIPDSTFFSFCSELLTYYKDNEQVMHISGNNFQNGKKYGDGSYYFSHYSHSWGWATWARAWKQYRTAVADFPTYDRENRIEELHFSKPAKKFWLKQLRNNKNWDSRWMYTTWHQNGLCVTPNVNLVSNIGFDTDATHTVVASPLANISTSNMGAIIHPSACAVDSVADEYTFRHAFYTKPLVRIKNKVLQMLTGHR